MSAPQIWLITGCSSGLGLSLVRAALAAGHSVIATSRNPSRSPALVAEVEAAGGAWLPLDVAGAHTEAQVGAALRVFGRVDVLVNNAGYGTSGAVEDVSLDLAREQFETNFFGVLRVLKAVLPGMRARQSGTIVNVSSSVGLTGVPGLGLYAASKFALEGLTESLAPELAPFNIRVLLVEPGALRTGFLSRGADADPRAVVAMSEGYRGTMAEGVVRGIMETDGRQKGDPERAARRVVEVVDGTGMFAEERGSGVFRVPLGKDVGEAMLEKGRSLVETAERLRDVWASVDFDDE